MRPEVVLLTTAELAEQFRVHPSTIRRWANEGRIRAVAAPGRNKRYRKADVEAVLLADAESGAA